MFTRLYIHIPFCVRKCPYCSFVSQTPQPGDLDAYQHLLLQEMALAAQHYPSAGLDSLYFGGGTPALLAPASVASLIEQADRHWGLNTTCEITLEANPGAVSPRYLADLHSAGITRLSLGVQSFQPPLLHTLGRIHSADEAIRTFDTARQQGFNDIGIDLINGLPGETMAEWHLDLEQAIALAPEHISVYSLSIEPGTPFASIEFPPGRQPADDDTAAEMFELAHDRLTAHGYEHYEIANYGRPGHHSRHNSGYWHRDGYLGLGLAAHSLLHQEKYGTRWANPVEMSVYAQAIQTGQLHHDDIHQLSRDEAMAEHMFLGLRLAQGVSLNRFRSLFGVELYDEYANVVSDPLLARFLRVDDRGIRLTTAGMLLSNQVLSRFLR